MLGISFRDAETIHRLALEKAKSSRTDANFDTICYNIMVAIARQPMRFSDALEFRAHHLEQVTRAEIIFVDLMTRLQRDKDDRNIYEQAEMMLRSGEVIIGDAWWTEREDALGGPN